MALRHQESIHQAKDATYTECNQNHGYLRPAVLTRKSSEDRRQSGNAPNGKVDFLVQDHKGLANSIIQTTDISCKRFEMLACVGNLSSPVRGGRT